MPKLSVVHLSKIFFIKKRLQYDIDDVKFLKT